jgi:magnesium-transporting ATPase (P-type)
MLLLHHVDHLYHAGPFGAGLGSTRLAPDAVAALLHFHRVFVASSVLLWLAMCCVKFSFLCFFRRLIWRQPGRIMAWWWAVLAFTAATTAYTVIIHLAACPHYGNLPKLGKDLIPPS